MWVASIRFRDIAACVHQHLTSSSVFAGVPWSTNNMCERSYLAEKNSTDVKYSFASVGA